MRRPLIDVPEAASRLGIAPKTIYKWIEQGRLPFVRIGRLIRLREEDLEAWVCARVHDGREPAGLPAVGR